eukprot:5560516-Pyramimonas_sp.AAC.1
MSDIGPGLGAGSCRILQDLAGFHRILQSLVDLQCFDPDQCVPGQPRWGVSSCGSHSGGGRKRAQRCCVSSDRSNGRADHAVR